MTYSPPTYLEFRDVWQRETGLAADALGIQHWSTSDADGGYHDGVDLLKKIDRYLGSASPGYSVRESTRDQPGTDGAAAFDLGWFDVTVLTAAGTAKRVTLLDYNRWLVAQCRAGAADTLWLREVIYTLDQKTVQRWDRLGIRDSGDDSHLTHTHHSGFRDEENTPKAPLAQRFWREMRGLRMSAVDNTDPAYNDLIFRVAGLYGNVDGAAVGRPALGPNGLREQLRRIENLVAALTTIVTAARDQESARDQLTAAALSQLVSAGTNVDTATILNAINAKSSQILTGLAAQRERQRKSAQAEAIVFDDNPDNDPPV